jgi:hypothetical protein
VLYIAQCLVYVPRLQTWLDEGNYVMKGWWYVTGAMHPYSDEDATSYMPVFLYAMGVVQKLFGVGHLAGRVFSALLGLGCLGLLFVLGPRLLGGALEGALAALLVAMNPTAVKYMCTATPYSLVSFVSLVALWRIAGDGTGAWPRAGLALGAVFAFLLLTRNNLIVGVVLLSFFYCTRAGLGRAARVLGVAAAVTAAAFLAAFAVWHDRFLQVALYLPGLASLLWKLGLARGDMFHVLALTTSAFQPIPSPEVTREAFERYLLGTYPLVTGACAVGLVAWLLSCLVRRRLTWGGLPFCLVYFAVQAVVHVLGSQTYCSACIQAYANYFYVFGALGAAGTLGFVARMVARRAPAGRIVAIGVVLLALTIEGRAALQAESRAFQMSPPGQNHLDTLRALAGGLRPLIGPGARGAALSQQFWAAQATFLAGGVLLTPTINLLSSHRQIKPGLDAAARRQARDSARALGLWTAGTLEQRLRDEAEFVVVERAPMHFEAFQPLMQDGRIFGGVLAEGFFKRGEVSANGVTLEVHRRRPVQP